MEPSPWDIGDEPLPGPNPAPTTPSEPSVQGDGPCAPPRDGNFTPDPSVHASPPPGLSTDSEDERSDVSKPRLSEGKMRRLAAAAARGLLTVDEEDALLAEVIAMSSESASVVAEIGVDPGTDVGADHPAEIGMDPGTDIGADHGADIGVDPGNGDGETVIKEEDGDDEAELTQETIVIDDDVEEPQEAPGDPMNPEGEGPTDQSDDTGPTASAQDDSTPTVGVDPGSSTVPTQHVSPTRPPYKNRSSRSPTPHARAGPR